MIDRVEQGVQGRKQLAAFFQHGGVAHHAFGQVLAQLGDDVGRSLGRFGGDLHQARHFSDRCAGLRLRLCGQRAGSAGQGVADGLLLPGDALAGLFPLRGQGRAHRAQALAPQRQAFGVARFQSRLQIGVQLLQGADQGRRMRVETGSGRGECAVVLAGQCGAGLLLLGQCIAPRAGGVASGLLHALRDRIHQRGRACLEGAGELRERALQCLRECVIGALLLGHRGRPGSRCRGGTGCKAAAQPIELLLHGLLHALVQCTGLLPQLLEGGLQLRAERCGGALLFGKHGGQGVGGGRGAAGKAVIECAQLLLHGLGDAVLHGNAALIDVLQRALQLLSQGVLRTFLRGQCHLPVFGGRACALFDGGADSVQLLLHGAAHAFLQGNAVPGNLFQCDLQLRVVGLLGALLRSQRRFPMRGCGAGAGLDALGNAVQLLLHGLRDVRLQCSGIARDAGHGGVHRRLQSHADSACAFGDTGLQRLLHGRGKPRICRLAFCMEIGLLCGHAFVGGNAVLLDVVHQCLQAVDQGWHQGALLLLQLEGFATLIRIRMRMQFGGDLQIQPLHGL